MTKIVFDKSHSEILKATKELKSFIKKHQNGDFGIDCTFSTETMEQLEFTVSALKEAEIRLKRVANLISGDDSETIFHRELERELRKAKEY